MEQSEKSAFAPAIENKGRFPGMAPTEGLAAT